VVARRAITSTPIDHPPEPDGIYGSGDGVPISFVVIGDSSAVGYGVAAADETPGALLSAGLAQLAGRPVALTTVAQNGTQSSDLAGQVDKALVVTPDVTLVIIGGNDITHKVPLAESVRLLTEAVRRLREAGSAVVVGTCPDLGTVEPIAPPLKQVARAWSRRLAAAQTIAVIKEGGRTVSCGSILGPEFAAAPALLFGPDQFHPSAEGYRALANLLIPSLLAALGLSPAEEALPEPFRGEGVLPVTRAAIRAVNQTGTELDGTELASDRGGVRGLWVELRHRRRRPQAKDEAPEASETADAGTS
jgi:lysophospholipase L1-like esterase